MKHTLLYRDCERLYKRIGSQELLINLEDELKLVEKSCSFFDSREPLSLVFSWTASPQGWGFWNAIHSFTLSKEYEVLK